jgi:subtilisin family serine protease
MSIPGLEKTSTGQTKVIDAIDFSESNVVGFQRATIEGSGSARSASAPGMPVRLHGLDRIDPAPAGEDTYIGYIDESLYRNSSIRDFNGDGDSRSMFGALLYRAADGWRVVVDTDADSSLADEKPVGSYRATHETFQFKQANTFQKAPLTFAPTIDTANHIVSFHYDMGGHGTHVSGIAAGYAINNEPGFNGLAPGAQIISCKFSGDLAKDNTVTGSMKRAFEFAARTADSLQQFHTPVVVNMSFGIGSSLEGRADIETFIDQLLLGHPNLYVITSAGNEGPGLSSIGIPASASRIIAVGALLPHGIGRDSYGASLDHDIIWDFSSRGGEVAKPDIVAPGTAISTITRFAYDSRASGTSMASPYTAGAVAVLLSAMRQEDSTWMPTQELIRRALRYSARPLPGVAPIEQGGGVLDLRRAYQLLERYRRRGCAADLPTYNISTFAPNYPDAVGSTAFWRSNYVPGGEWRQSFTISRALDRDEEEKDFFRAYTLEPTADWLKPVQGNVYIRNTGVAKVDVLYDREKMKEPGLYSASIIGRRASAKGKAANEEIEFELTNTVIVPYLFSADKGYTVTTPRQKLDGGDIKRFYFAVPPGAAALTFTLSVPKGSRSNVSGSVIDRNGYKAGYLPRVKGDERAEGSSTVTASDLGEGIIEVVVQADAFEGSGGASEFTLSASALMLELKTDVARSGDGRQLNVEALNSGSQVLRGSLSYSLKGFGRVVLDTMHGDTFSMPLKFQRGDGALWISPRFSRENYLHATDILAQIVDTAGNVQAQQTYNKPDEWLFMPNFNRESGSGERYTLQVIFASGNYRNLPDIPIEIIENHVRPSEPRSIGSYGASEFIPSIPEEYHASLTSVPDIPAGYYGLGDITFKSPAGDQVVPFEFRFDQ